MTNINDIDILKYDNNYSNLVIDIKSKLNFIRNKLNISFIGKLSTPKNLFIKDLTNIEFSSNSTTQIKRYCAVISNCRELNNDESFISNFNHANLKEFENSKNGCAVFNSKRNPIIMPIENTGSWLNDNAEDMDKFEIYLSKSDKAVLNKYILYNTPPIGYSDELDKFVVEQCYKSCYLYVFVINAEESILEEEMKIIELLNKRNVIELKFIITYSRDLSKEDYTKIENDYLNKIKVITSQFTRIIIISGHGYKSYGKDSKDNLKDPVPIENRIKDLGEFIHKEPTEEMILAAVTNYKLKKNSAKSEYLENNENIKRELQNAVENIIININSKSVNSVILKNEIPQFNETVTSLELKKIYVIIENQSINILDLSQALCHRPISIENIKNVSSIVYNFNKKNNEEFELQYEGESDKNKYNLHKLKCISDLISNYPKKNPNISIEIYLDNETHPIIKDEMKIIYYNNDNAANEDLMKEYDDHDEIAVILKYKSDGTNYKDKIDISIIQNMISNDRVKKCITNELQIEIIESINSSNFDSIFQKILSNIKYRKVINEIISKFNYFISNLNESIRFDMDIKEFSDWQLHKLNKSIKSTLKNDSEDISTTVNKEIDKFVNKMFLENMNISDKMVSSSIIVMNIFTNKEIKEMIDQYEKSIYYGKIHILCKMVNNLPNMFFQKNNKISKKTFLNFYADKKTEFLKKVEQIYISKAKQILSNSENYKKMLKVISDNLQTRYCISNIFVC